MSQALLMCREEIAAKTRVLVFIDMEQHLWAHCGIFRCIWFLNSTALAGALSSGSFRCHGRVVLLSCWTVLAPFIDSYAYTMLLR